ncbi:MAG: class I SAM-dependent methyltransferase [Pseudoxanthomonas sp.]
MGDENGLLEQRSLAGRRKAMNSLRRLWTRIVKARSAEEAQPALPMPLPAGQGCGFVERVEISELPIVRVFGWHAGGRLPDILLSTRTRNSVGPHAVARMLRKDVPPIQQEAGPFCGFRIDYLLDPNEIPERLLLDGERFVRLGARANCASVEPHYAHLFKESRVRTREHIYGSGPPTTVAEEFKAFAEAASGRVLDFGAGSGDLATHLARRGVDIVGLELDEPRIRGALQQDALPLVRLYAGDLPLPFESETFDWIVSTEVLEHLHDPQRFIPEFARVLKPGGRMLVTTPDISSIPSSFLTGTVPWHLLEATHFNFFTTASLAGLYSTHFDPVDFYSLADNRVNGFHVPGSIGAIFGKR